jgi:hypothetical protein
MYFNSASQYAIRDVEVSLEELKRSHITTHWPVLMKNHGAHTHYTGTETLLVAENDIALYVSTEITKSCCQNK